MSAIADAKLDACCKALWESTSHKMLQAAGHTIDYESQPNTIKLDLLRQAKAILKTAENFK